MRKQNQRHISRRSFVGNLAMGAVGTTLVGSCTTPVVFEQEQADFNFVTPFDGGVYHEGSGTPVMGGVTDLHGKRGVKIEVAGMVPAGITPQITTGDGIEYPVNVAQGRFCSVVTLYNRITEIRAKIVINGKARVIRTRPVLVKNSYPRMRCYIDDHSFFFREIAAQRYKSIFECFYLAKLRELHQKYGVKINLNCFNSTPERDFTLSMFPACYKSEFEDNAHWMRLAFHSENEFPNIPYLNATATQFAAEFDMVAKQLQRIAGRAYTAGLQIHWADVTPECYPELVKRGATMLQTRGRLPDDKARKICDYHLPDSVLAFLCEHQGWMDFDSSAIFYDGSTGVLDQTPVAKVVEKLQSRLKHQARNHLINIAAHEQYWFPFYRNFRPDMYERFAVAVEHVLELGYKPIWIEDGFFGSAE